MSHIYIHLSSLLRKGDLLNQSCGFPKLWEACEGPPECMNNCFVYTSVVTEVGSAQQHTFFA